MAFTTLPFSGPKELGLEVWAMELDMFLRQYFLQPANSLDTGSVLAENTEAQGTVVEFSGRHGDLKDLDQDQHSHYALLQGRGSGQTIHGGISTGGNLILRPNSADNSGYVGSFKEHRIINPLDPNKSFSIVYNDILNTLDIQYEG